MIKLVENEYFHLICSSLSVIWEDSKEQFPYQYRKQAGAELCQAQKKLGLAKPALPIIKLRRSSILKEIEDIFH